VRSSITNNTYRVLSQMDSTVKKSVARIPRAWLRRNSPQVGPDRRGAGPSPLRRSSVRIAAAVRSDGLVAAGSNAAYDKDVYIFEPGGSTPIATYEFGHLPDQETWAHTLVDGGLAWGGDRIYAVTHVSSEPDNVTLRVRVVG
jgi:hypothetical protein